MIQNRLNLHAPVQWGTWSFYYLLSIFDSEHGEPGTTIRSRSSIGPLPPTPPHLCDRFQYLFYTSEIDSILMDHFLYFIVLTGEFRYCRTMAVLLLWIGGGTLFCLSAAAGKWSSFSHLIYVNGKVAEKKRRNARDLMFHRRSADTFRFYSIRDPLYNVLPEVIHISLIIII